MMSISRRGYSRSPFRGRRSYNELIAGVQTMETEFRKKNLIAPDSATVEVLLNHSPHHLDSKKRDFKSSTYSPLNSNLFNDDETKLNNKCESSHNPGAQPQVQAGERQKEDHLFSRRSKVLSRFRSRSVPKLRGITRTSGWQEGKADLRQDNEDQSRNSCELFKSLQVKVVPQHESETQPPFPVDESEERDDRSSRRCRPFMQFQPRIVPKSTGVEQPQLRDEEFEQRSRMCARFNRPRLRCKDRSESDARPAGKRQFVSFNLPTSKEGSSRTANRESMSANDLTEGFRAAISTQDGRQVLLHRLRSLKDAAAAMESKEQSPTERDEHNISTKERQENKISTKERKEHKISTREKKKRSRKRKKSKRKAKGQRDRQTNEILSKTEKEQTWSTKNKDDDPVPFDEAAADSSNQFTTSLFEWWEDFSFPAFMPPTLEEMKLDEAALPGQGGTNPETRRHAVDQTTEETTKESSEKKTNDHVLDEEIYREIALEAPWDYEDDIEPKYYEI